jgi:hypothetical protein
VDPVWRPFCSERCKMADLGRWLSEDYRVPDEATPDRTDDDRPGARDDEDPEHD